MTPKPVHEDIKIGWAFRRGMLYKAMATYPFIGKPGFRRAVFGPRRPTRGWAQRAVERKAERLYWQDWAGANP